MICDKNGQEIKVVNEVPLNEIIPKGFMAARKGKKNLTWRAHKPATLIYAEALDGANPATKHDTQN